MKLRAGAILVLGALGACGGGGGGTKVDAALAPDSGLAADANVVVDAAAADSSTVDASLPDAQLAVDARTPDAGAPHLVAPTPVDFGSLDCGGTAPAARTVSIGNTGTAPLSFAATLTGTGAASFSLTGTASGSIAPGGSADLMVGALAMPTTATSGGMQTANLHLVTNDGTTDVALTATASGGRLVLAPASAGFGLTPVNVQAPNQPLTLTNLGNRSVTVNFSQPADSQFALTWTSGAAVTLAPAGTVAGLTARFHPTTTTAASSSAAITVTGTLCSGGSASSIPMSGQGSLGALAYSPSVLDFGQVDCGGTADPATQDVTVRNAGTSAFTWTAALQGGPTSHFSILPSSATLQPGDMATITVTAKPVTAPSSVAANALGDTLHITTTIPGDTMAHDVDLRESAAGAILVFTPMTTLQFSNARLPVATAETLPFTLTNVGNRPAPQLDGDIFGPASGVFTIDNPALGDLVATDTVHPSLTGNISFQPVTVGVQDAHVDLLIEAGTPLCAPLPSLPLRGTGTNGVLTVDRSSLDFGHVNCNTRGAAQTITVNNTGDGAFSITTLGFQGSAPHAYTASVAPATPIPPGGSAIITVTPPLIPLPSAVTDDLYLDTLSITTDIFDETLARTIPVHMTPQGAIIDYVVTADMATVPAGSTSTVPVDFMNTGNTAASLMITNSMTTFGVAPRAVNVGAAGQSTVTFTFQPAASAAAGTLFMEQAAVNLTSGVLCQDLPGPVRMTGNTL